MKIKPYKVKVKTSHGFYIKVLAPDHPYADKHGYVLEHRLVVEQKLGRLLKRSEIVHHINHVKHDNRLENLIVMSQTAHARLHATKYTKEDCLQAIREWAKEHGRSPRWSEFGLKGTHEYGAETPLSATAIMQYFDTWDEAVTAAGVPITKKGWDRLSPDTLDLMREIAKEHPRWSNEDVCRALAVRGIKVSGLTVKKRLAQMGITLQFFPTKEEWLQIDQWRIDHPEWNTTQITKMAQKAQIPISFQGIYRHFKKSSLKTPPHHY